MTAFDEVQPRNRDQLINDLYELQVSLKILAEQLAYSYQPDLDHQMLSFISAMSGYLLAQQPSLRRH